MADTEHYTPEQIADALRATRGRRFQAARQLGCSERTIRNYLARYPALHDVLEGCKGERVDDAEEGLDYAVKCRQPWAIALTLKTLGRDRGYVEKQDHAHQFSGPLQVQVVTYTDETTTDDAD